ncbi:MAG: YidB family protein [Rhodomicrobium sp.]
MSFLEALSGALNQAMRQHGAAQEGAGEPGADPLQNPSSLSQILAGAGLGGLASVVERLSGGGLAEEVRSWLGNGANLPVSVEQLRNALGDERVQQAARQLGVPADRVLEILSRYLPGAVDEASPRGHVEEPGQAER